MAQISNFRHVKKLTFAMNRSFYLPETSCLTFLKERRKRETLKFITCYGNLLFLRDTWMKEDGQNIETRRFYFLCFLQMLARWNYTEDRNLWIKYFVVQNEWNENSRVLFLCKIISIISWFQVQERKRLKKLLFFQQIYLLSDIVLWPQKLGKSSVKMFLPHLI